MNPFENLKRGKYGRKRLSQEGLGDLTLDIKETKVGKIEYYYQYSDGSRLEISEDNDGMLTIILRVGDNTIDLRSYMPYGYKFVTRNHKEAKRDRDLLAKEGMSLYIKGNTKLIYINDVVDPRQILSILHEMSHAQANENRRIPPLNLFSSKKEMLSFLSRVERSAWAGAIKLARRIAVEHRVNIMEVFGSEEEVQKYIYGFLMAYRYKGERVITGGKVRRFFHALFGKDIGKEGIEFMSTLFDKGTLVRKYGVMKNGYK